MGDQTREIEELECVFTDTMAKPIKISYATMYYITKNFIQMIGDGGFGEVYLGGLRNGMVAVKKLLKINDFSHKQFSDEVACLSKANHRNIVRFLGYCADTQGIFMEFDGKLKMIEEPRMLLCFEYVPNGNLHHYIKEKTYGYEWSVRYQIIKGICQGLHYIHQNGIIHLDLKPANVLMGENMEPKVTDFGVSRLIDDKGQCTIATKNLFGTLGYIAPELIDKKIFSFKSDIYSLGVIMINLITGHTGGMLYKWHETIDADCPQIKRCIEIAQNCVVEDPHARPTTGEIINSLNEVEILLGKDPPIINEPQDDPNSALYKDVQKFWALPAVTLGERRHSRVDALYTELDVPECLLGASMKPGKVSYHLLLSITENFSDARKIGQGGFASLFVGILPQCSIAVKRYFKGHDIDRRFRQEVTAMTVATEMARHKNIVQFLGYCSYTEEETMKYEGKFIMAMIQERLLCLEYLPKGTLDCYISDASCGLEWRARRKIIKGICEGLQYLHRKHIVHLDLKAANILLDDNMEPKIFDFNLSRCFDDEQSRTITSNLCGTMPYVAPEYMMKGVITFKSDIYSLGIIIVEILTGKRGDFAIDWVLQSWKQRLEKSSQDTVLLEQVRVCAEISMACKDFNQEKRPDIQRIVEMLGETETNGAETTNTKE